MSTLIKTLENRIREITHSIDARKAELSAYERLLQVEVAHDTAPADKNTNVTAQPSKSKLTGKGTATKNADLAASPITTNKTQMVADIVKSFGKAGASAKEVDKVLTARKIERSNNLVYTALSYLLAQKKLQRRDGQYFSIETTAGKPTKHKMSPEGLQRIKEALKKRWAAKKAAEKKVKQ
jgi:hypothetical protein